MFILQERCICIKLSFSLSIIFTKLYLCQRYEKLIKSGSKLTKHLNICKINIYLKKKNVLSEN